MLARKLLLGTAGCLAASVLLQVVAFAIPGWVVSTTPSTGQKDYTGQVYVVQCKESTGCKAMSYASYYEQFTTVGTKVWLYGVVSSALMTLTGIAFCSGIGLLKLIAIKKGVWLDHYTTFTLLFLTVANAMQWDLVADFSSSTVFLRIAHEWGADNTATFPFSVFLYAIASALVSFVIMVHLTMFWKKHIRPGIFRYGTV